MMNGSPHLDGLLEIQTGLAREGVSLTPVEMVLRETQTGQYILTATKVVIVIDVSEGTIIAEVTELCGEGGKPMHTDLGQPLLEKELYSTEYRRWLESDHSTSFEGDIFQEKVFRYLVQSINDREQGA